MVFNRSATKDVFEQLAEPDEPIDDEAVDDAEGLDLATDANPDPDDAEVAETLAPDEDADAILTPSRGKRWLRRIGVSVAGLALIAAVGLAGFFGWQLKQQNALAADGRAALDVARNYAVTLTSVDYQKIDENTTQVLDGATGEFKDMYSQSAAQLRQLLIDNKAVSHGTVIDAAIKSVSNDKVDVLLFIDQSISNTVSPQPRIDRSRVGMTMERIDNRWLASKVNIN